MHDTEKLFLMAYKMWWQLFPAEIVLSCKLCITCTWPVKSKASGLTHRTNQEPKQLKMYFYYLCIIYREYFKYMIEVVEVYLLYVLRNFIWVKFWVKAFIIIKNLLFKNRTFADKIYILANPTGLGCTTKVQQ